MDIRKKNLLQLKRCAFFQIFQSIILGVDFLKMFQRIPTTGGQASELSGVFVWSLFCTALTVTPQAKICVDGDTPGHCCCFSPWCSTERNGCVRIRVRNCCLLRRQPQRLGDPTMSHAKKRGPLVPGLFGGHLLGMKCYPSYCGDCKTIIYKGPYIKQYILPNG